MCDSATLRNFQGRGVCGNPEAIHEIVRAVTENDDPISDFS